MPNAHINKVIYGGNTLIDLTADTVTAADVQSGKIFHLKDGSTTTGTNTWDAYTQDANANAAEILLDKTAYVNKNKVTGTMPNIGTTTLVISTTNQVSIPSGYHDGGGKAVIDSTELGKLIGSNIKNGVTILGVEGTLTGSEMVSVTTKTITNNSSFFYFFLVSSKPFSLKISRPPKL